MMILIGLEYYFDEKFPFIEPTVKKITDKYTNTLMPDELIVDWSNPPPYIAPIITIRTIMS